MHGVVISHLQNCLSSKDRADKQFCGTKQAFPNNVFSFVSLSVKGYTSGSVKLASQILFPSAEYFDLGYTFPRNAKACRGMLVDLYLG